VRNVGDLPAGAAAAHGSRTAIIDPDGTTVSWSQLEQRVQTIAGGLRDAGVGPGVHVGVMLANGSTFAAVYWGVLRAGGTVVPINPGYTSPERLHIADDAGVAAVVTDIEAKWPSEVKLLAPSALHGTAIPKAVTGDDGAQAAEGGSGPDAQAAEGGSGPDAQAAEGGSGSDCAVICYTSGTTGHPKGARLTHANLLANLDDFSNLPLLWVSPDDVLLGLLPFFHVFGLNVVLNAAARHGCTILAVDRFTPRTTAAAMIEHGVTVAYGAPPVFAALAGLPVDVVMPRLRAAVSGADALPVSTWTRFRDRWGIEILEGYGLTETAPVLASNAAAAAPRAGTVGVALDGVRIELRDPAGAAVPTGSVGEIHAAGPNVFDGYHGQPAATAEVLRDGWFATGDLGSFDADGYLSIVGRLKDMIIVSGFNVYPREVEDVLLEHPAVTDAAVVGVPDERTGEKVRAVVVVRPLATEVTSDELMAHCRERLARYKLPRELQLVAALPRLNTGKVARRLLRQ
jgi:long-chain acyl-CoA synthetase